MSDQEDGSSYAGEVLEQIITALAEPESLVEGNIRFVAGWVEKGAGRDAIRVVYDRVGADRRFGRRFIAAPEAWDRDPSHQAWAVAEDIDEPLGRYWDLLVEEEGVWWWGDGYPTLDQHPEIRARRSPSGRIRQAWSTMLPNRSRRLIVRPAEPPPPSTEDHP